MYPYPTIGSEAILNKMCQQMTQSAKAAIVTKAMEYITNLFGYLLRHSAKLL